MPGLFWLFILYLDDFVIPRTRRPGVFHGDFPRGPPQGSPQGPIGCSSACAVVAVRLDSLLEWTLFERQGCAGSDSQAAEGLIRMGRHLIESHYRISQFSAIGWCHSGANLGTHAHLGLTNNLYTYTKVYIVILAIRSKGLSLWFHIHLKKRLDWICRHVWLFW